MATDETFLLSDSDVGEIEREWAGGLTSKQIVDLFESRGIRLSEATFRKYVQMGMLPRCRRVGRKGKHRGSCGIYPVVTVRRVNAIKRLMAQRYTIEEIQNSFLRFQNEIETLEGGIRDLFSRFDAEVPRLTQKTRKSLIRELMDAKKTAGDLVRRINELDRRLAGSPPAMEAATAGATGGAGERW